jgi:CubicO group peptidase (beta-lactamase class C family)
LSAKKNRVSTWLAVLILGAGVLFAAILGIWGWASITATPLHPGLQEVPSVTRAAPLPKWADAVALGRTRARASVIEENLPGLSVAVGVEGDLVWAEGFGSADLGSHELDFTGQLALGNAVLQYENRVGVTPETRFRIVGVSMALTSAAVGLLLEKGRLKLDDEIQTYVPAFPKKQWPVTLRHLMAHVAGVRNDGGDEAPLNARCERTVDGFQLDGFAERPLRFEPGTQYGYSTYGWIVVSEAVEAAAREPFFTFMRRQIFEPLGMTETMPESWSEPIRNRATFYFPRFAADPRYGPDLVREGDHSCFAGAGAFLSTPSDLVRFGLAMGRGQLLQPATVTTLQTPQRLVSGAETGSGLGWRLETVPLAGEPTRLARQDDQRSVGGSTSLLVFPERGIVVAVASNISYAKTDALAMSIAQAFAANQRPASPSVNSMRVPAGSTRNAIFSPMPGTSRNGMSNVTPSAASFLQNASSPFTSKPM